MARFRERATGRVRRDLGSGLLLALLAGLMFLPCGSCVPAGLNRKYAGPRERSPAMTAYYSYPKQPIEPNSTVTDLS